MVPSGLVTVLVPGGRAFPSTQTVPSLLVDSLVPGGNKRGPAVLCVARVVSRITDPSPLTSTDVPGGCRTPSTTIIPSVVRVMTVSFGKVTTPPGLTGEP